MRILVAGATGQVALSLIERAKAGGHELTAIGRPSFDLGDDQSIEQIMSSIEPDMVINAAAYTNVDLAEDNEAEAFRVNADGAGALAKNCASRDIPILHISTDYVFDGTGQGACTETDPVAPIGVYGRSKLAGEEAVRASNAKHLIFRTAWVYSPFGKNFLKTMLRLAAERDEIGVVGDQYGNPTYALHIADGLLAVCEHLARAELSAPPVWGTYNMVAQGDASWAGFAEAIFSESQAQGGAGATVNHITSDQFPTKAKRPANSRLDTARLSTALGVTLPDWRLGMVDCVARVLGSGMQNV